MPDSYGRPLCTSPRLRWEISHAAPIVRKTNDTPAKANPTTYQMPVNRTPFRATRPGWRRWPEDPCGARRHTRDRVGCPRRHSSSGSEADRRCTTVAQARPAERRSSGWRRRTWGHVGERRAPSARAGSRATPRQVVPDRGESCGAAVMSGNRYIAVFRWRSGAVRCASVRAGIARGGTRAAQGRSVRRASPRPKAITRKRPIAPGRAAGTARSGPRGRPRASSPDRPGSPGAAPPSRGRPGTRPGSSSRDGPGRRRSPARSTAVTSTWAVRSWRPTCRYGSSWTRGRRYARSVPSRRRIGSYSSVAGGRSR